MSDLRYPDPSQYGMPDQGGVALRSASYKAIAMLGASGVATCVFTSGAMAQGAPSGSAQSSAQFASQVQIPTPPAGPIVHPTMPWAIWLALAFAVLLFIALGVFIFATVRKESASRQAAAAPKRRSSTADNPVWRDSGKGRRSRDPTDLRTVDDDLPPITVMTGATWADKDQQVSSRQSHLIAAAPATETNIYKTGYNPFFRQASSDQIEVEEVADLVQQAELMLTLANYPAAISMLTRHIRDTEQPAPKAWLMLFELYAKTDREDQYTNLAKGFKIQFNADVPTWNAQKTEPARHLEEYPRVMERICAAWHTEHARALLTSLLFDDRGGSRAGFQLEAYGDLILLLDIVDSLGAIEEEIAERREIEQKLQNKPLI